MGAPVLTGELGTESGKARVLGAFQRFPKSRGPVGAPKVVGTARCAVTARKAGGTIRMRPSERRFMERFYLLCLCEMTMFTTHPDKAAPRRAR